MYHITGYRRKVVQENLRNAFPEKSEQERKEIERKFFRYFADLIMEIIKSISISEKELRKHVVFENEEIIKQYNDEGKSLIGVVAHYGNWEFGGLACSTITHIPRLYIYKPLSNKIFDDFFIKVRSKFGATLIPMKSTLRVFTAHRKQRFISALIADQTPVMHEAHYFTQFLNQPTAVFLGIEKLAKMTGASVMFCDMKVIKRGYYSCKFIELIDDPKITAEHEITEIHVQYLEKMIRQEPQYWLWSHRRWKFKPEDKQ
ncbi:MAG: lauroyl acyltransferase [Sphingobacteriaceae bacterium]|nr:MAG: lauroyl acyltransferase [Sphingobacteriaceae bacterium]